MVPVAASLVGPALHDESPVHSAEQLVPRQLTADPQLLGPEQVTVDIFPPSVMLPAQLCVPPQVIWQFCEAGPPH